MKVEIKVSEVKWNNEKDLKASVQVVLDDMYKMIGIKVREKEDENGSFYTVEYPGYESTHEGEKTYKAFIGPVENEEASMWWHNVFERKIINSVSLLNSSGISNIFVRADLQGVSADDFECNFTKSNRDDSMIKGFGSIVIGGMFKIDNIKIMSSKTDPANLYVSTPSFRMGTNDPEGRPRFQDYFYPISAELREKYVRQVLDAFNKEDRKTKDGYEENAVFGSIDKDLAVFIKGMGATIFYKDGKNLVEFETPDDIQKYDGTIICSFDEAKYYQELAEKIEKQKEADTKVEKNPKNVKSK